MINKKFAVDAFGYGFALWLLGFVLSLVLFMVIPVEILGWFLLAVMTPLTIFVAFRKVAPKTLSYALSISAIWLVIALVLDYIFIVTMFSVQNYYDLDVGIYYVLTVLIPLAALKFSKNVP